LVWTGDTAGEKMKYFEGTTVAIRGTRGIIADLVRELAARGRSEKARETVAGWRTDTVGATEPNPLI
jgi:hypothetical protein